jgi:hypothetical protein
MTQSNSDSSNNDTANNTETPGAGFWGSIGTVFTFFGKILEAIKRDKQLVIVWGISVLFLVMLLGVLAIGNLTSGANLTVIIVIAVIVAGLCIYSITRSKSTASPVANDPGISVVERFYRLIGEKKLSEAYDMIHPSRIKVIHQSDPDFDSAGFARTYETTRRYEHMNVQFDGGSNRARNYTVSFDVLDEFPRNRLYKTRNELFNEVFNQGCITSQQIIEGVIADLKAYYIVPDSVLPWIDDFIKNRQYGSLYDPEFVYEVKRNLEKVKNSILIPKENTPSSILVWRHYIQSLQLMQDNKTWKIGEGLSASVTAPYLDSSPI